MLEWASPWWFAALPLALLPALGWLRPWALRFSATGAMREGASLRRWVSGLPALLQLVVLLLVVVALARPQKVVRETERESEGVDILLAIDTSGSMDAPDMGVAGTQLTRLEAGKRVMAAFVEARTNDRVGLVVFGQEAFTQVPLTLDHTGLHDFIGQLEIGMAGKSATAVGDAIAAWPGELREAIVLFEFEEMSQAEIAVTVGASVKAVEARVARAREKLRVALRRWV